MKKCKDCGKIKAPDDFYGVQGECKNCTKEAVRKNRKKNHLYYKKNDEYRRRFNFRRIFFHKYSMMKQRVEGRSIHKVSVEGKDILSKDAFIKWCYAEKNFKEFVRLHKNWVENNFAKRFSPSIDRVNNELGYLPKNMQWLTQSANSSKH